MGKKEKKIDLITTYKNIRHIKAMQREQKLINESGQIIEDIEAATKIAEYFSQIGINNPRNKVITNSKIVELKLYQENMINMENQLDQAKFVYS